MSFGEGTYYMCTTLGNHKAVDLEASEPTGRIIEYQSHGGKNQQWRVTKITHEEYSIQSVATNTYITAPNGDNDMTARGSKLAPECNAVARWKIVKASSKGDAYFVRNVANTNKVLDVSGSNQADLTPILVYTYHGGNNQQFTFKEV
ncbi:carbohydrate-binding module family 13 protein [Trichoderma sp. SZMC 28012]